MNSFRCELFEDPTEYEENLLRDRKEDLPVLSQKQALPGKRAEFLRDAIALANTARMMGEPAYLLFGINDHCEIVGVEQYLAQYSGDWEKVSQQIKDLFVAFVEPNILKWRLFHGECQNKPVAYLQFEPSSEEKPYQVKKELNDKGNEKLTPGDCWIRIGESKQKVRAQEIAPDHDRYRYAYSTVPYVLPSHWERYFNGLLDLDDVRRDQSIKPYIELQVVNGQSLDQRIEQFLNAPSERLLIIKGMATSGKSALQNRLCARLAQENLAAIEGIRHREEFKPPPGWIPIRYLLRGRENEVEDVDKLTQALFRIINQDARFLKIRRPTQPERLFEAPDLQWLLCIDGMDELLRERVQQNFINSLRCLTEKYPKIKVLLTTRPLVIRYDPNTLPRTYEVEIAELTDRQIERFVSTQILSDSDLHQILEFLQNEPDLMALCRHTGHLVAVMRELVPQSNVQPLDYPAVNLEIPAPSFELDNTEDQPLVLPIVDETSLILTEESETKEIVVDELDYEEEPPVAALRVGRIIDRVYRYLWERECARWTLSIDKDEAFWESAGQLAIKSDGHNRLFGESFLQRYIRPPRPHVRLWLLSLGILLKSDYSQWEFYNHLVKVFFATWWIRNQLACKALDLVEKSLAACTTDFRDKVKALLPHIYDDDFTLAFSEQEETPLRAAPTGGAAFRSCGSQPQVPGGRMQAAGGRGCAAASGAYGGG